MSQPVKVSWRTTRKRVLERDQKCCQKCHQIQAEFHVHHIIPRDQGGTDDLENLVTLCATCHLEWEGLHLAYSIPFEKWLTIPPAGWLISWVINEDIWTEDKTAKEMRDTFLWVHRSLFEAAGPDGEEED